MNASKPDSAGIRFPPPAIFAGALLLAWVIDRFVRPMPIAGRGTSAVLPPGLFLLVLGVFLAAWGMITFRRAHTAIIPHRPATTIVEHGPYRFTRNPMYTGIAIMYCGGAALMDSAWPLILLPLVLTLMTRLVISREEAYLMRAFPAEYGAYRARVRRWV